MSEKKEYKVAVTELLRRVVRVKAHDEPEAHRRAMDAWHNGEILLGADDFDGAEFHVLGEMEGNETEKKLWIIDSKDVGGEGEIDG